MWDDKISLGGIGFGFYVWSDPTPEEPWFHPNPGVPGFLFASKRVGSGPNDILTSELKPGCVFLSAEERTILIHFLWQLAVCVWFYSSTVVESSPRCTSRLHARRLKPWGWIFSCPSWKWTNEAVLLSHTDIDSSSKGCQVTWKKIYGWNSKK